MNVRDMKALNLAPGEKRSLGPEDAIVLKVKKVRNWFGQQKEHVGISLEDASGDWISAAVFSAPSEIAKMEGEWIPIEPTPGSQSGVWLEGESYTARSGPKQGQEIRATDMKIMGGCFRWDKPQQPPGATNSPPPAQGTPQGQRVAQNAPGAVQRQDSSAPTDREMVAWLREAGKEVAAVVCSWGDPTTPHGEAAVITTVGSILTGMRIGAEHGKLRLTYGEEPSAPGAPPVEAYGGEDDDDSIPF